MASLNDPLAKAGCCGTPGILLVYDVTDRNSFNSVQNWVNQIQQSADAQVSRILIGNKCDMEDERQVSRQDGEQLAAMLGIQFFETSAKDDLNVEEAFVTIAREVKNRSMESDAAPTGGVNVRQQNKSSGGGGCCK